MTPQDLANLVQLRRARDLIDRDYAHQSQVSLTASPALGAAPAGLSGVAADPEPGTLALLGLAAVGTLRRRRRHH